MPSESELRELARALRSGEVSAGEASDILETLSSVPKRPPTEPPGGSPGTEADEDYDKTQSSDPFGDPRATAMYVTSSPAPLEAKAHELGAAGVGDASLSYVIREEIAKGGMGRVVLAHDSRIGRDVAIKEVHPKILHSPARGDRIERFLAEAQITGQLEHPCIIPIYQLGSNTKGAPFYSMKLVRGRTLSAGIREYHELPGGDRRRPIKRQELLQALIGVCDAIAFAHSKGVLHRDLKPTNVMLGDFGEAILIDWGLARARGGRAYRAGEIEDTQLVWSDAREHSASTMAGSMLGTPSYMAPEQARGDLEHVDERSDIFSLGAILYEILANRPPYMGTSKDETIGMAVERRLKPPREVASNVPRPLEAICLKAMAKDPEERYQTAKAMVEDLRRWQSDEPVSAYRDPWWTRARRWVRRHRVAASSATAAVVALAAAGAGWRAYDDWRVERVGDRAEQLLAAGQAEMGRQSWDEATRELASAMALVELEPRLARLRSIAGPLLAQSRQSSEADRERKQAEEKLLKFRRLRDEALFAGTLLVETDRASSAVLAASAAESALAVWDGGDREDLAKAIESAPLTASEKAEVRSSSFDLLYSLAEAKAAEAPGQKAEQRVESARGAVKILEMAQAFGPALRAFHERRSRYFDQAGDDVNSRKEREIAEGIEPTTATDYYLMGEDAFGAERYSTARTWFERSLRADPSRSAAQYMISVCDLNLGLWREAIAGLTACESRNLEFVGIPLLRGFARSELGDIEGAEEEFRVVESRRPGEYGLHLNRGVARLRHSRLEEAISDFQAALRIRPNDPGATIDLAEAYRLRSDLDKALGILNAALVRSPDDARLHSARAKLHLAKGNLDAARSDLERAIALSPSPKDIAELGRLLHRQGKLEESLAAYAKAAERDPTNREVDRLAALVLMDLRRPVDAIDRFNRYLSEPSTAPSAGGESADRSRWLAATYRERGLARMLTGDVGGAMSDFARAAESPVALREATTEYDRKQNEIMLGRRGWVYLSRNAELAEADFDRILSRDPKNSDALCGRAYARALRGLETEAIQDAEKALEVGPTHPGLTFNVACVHAECSSRSAAAEDAADAKAAKHAERSVELLHEAMRQCPEDRRREFFRSCIGDRALDGLRGFEGYRQFVREWSMQVGGSAK